MGKPPLDEAAKARTAARAKTREDKHSDAKAFIKRFSEHTERGTALSVAAYLDAKVTAFVSKMFVADDKIKPNMFRPEGGALASLKVKIDLCYLLGYLEKETYADLCKIVQIRNKFAHDQEANSFEFPFIDKKCRELSIFKDANEFFGNAEEALLQREFYTGFGYDLNDSKWAFVVAVGYLANKFQTTGHEPQNVRTNHIRMFSSRDHGRTRVTPHPPRYHKIH